MNCLDYIDKWHTFHTLPIKDVFFEEMLYHHFRDEGKQVQWNPGSHKSGVDLIVDDLRISCKSGLLKRLKRSNIGRFSVSSYRTTKAKNLNERREIIKENDSKFDIYYILLRGVEDYTTYSILKVEKDIFDISNYTEDQIHKEHDFISYKIIESNSQQLWFYINDYDKFKNLSGVSIMAVWGITEC